VGVAGVIGEFVVLLAAVYLATVALYFALGVGISWLNDRNPQRRIQQRRRGERRMAAEIRQSMASILVSSLSLAIGLHAQMQGWAPIPWALDWWTALPLFLLCMVLFDTWFYFAHRLLHTRPFYRFHALHHRSVAPTVWSNDSIGLVDTAISQGFYAVIVFFVPFPPVILLAHKVFDQINGTFGHAGFEYFAAPTARSPWPMLCTTYHDQHHAQFRYNYANYFSFWDRMLGTITPGYDRRVETLERTAAPLNLSAPEADAGDEIFPDKRAVPPAE
jgi:sterol desaturase/sphingolipid hydroxylase (fatty acid hydroxylase superfamily)